MRIWNLGTVGAGVLALVVGCSKDSGGLDPGAVPYVPGEVDPGATVALALTLEDLDALDAKLDAARDDTPEELRSNHEVQFGAALGYDPLTATDLGRVLDLTYGDEIRTALEAQVARDGFAIQAESQFPSFAYGYASIYAADLPVYVTTDMVLEALFRSHDTILQLIEQDALRPRLARLLTSIRAALVARVDRLPPDTASDLNFYLGVALSLLDGGHVDRREPPGVDTFVAAAMAAEGIERRTLFGVERDIDFSQFKPRGHYAGDAALESYFRAMIWLGRIDFRLIETTTGGSQVLRRRQVEAALTLRDLLDTEAFADYAAIDATITAFVGEHDFLTLQDLDALRSDLGDPESLAEVDDEALATALVEGQLTPQRIASQVMQRTGGGPATLPLSTSFALFGQRYTVDSHVLSNVVYDRVPTRVVPDPLDVAFGALGNDQAVALLGEELDKEAGYSGQLSAIRTLVDEHPSSYWEQSLYTSWLGAIRSLSVGGGAPDADLPTVARTEAWGRRLLNAQLASWAELRHNNVLYVKQSYTSNAACEYPDAYVDPYPEFFQRVVQHAELGLELLPSLGLAEELRAKIGDYFSSVVQINRTLAEMAELQRTGTPHSADHLAFINRTVAADVNCDGTVLRHDGWYADLHFDPMGAVEADPVITDVHTDIGGDLPVAREPSVLHVGTGMPRLFIVTVESCSGPHAYAGVVSAYHQKLEPGLTRLTDEEWKMSAYTDSTAPEWLDPVLTR